MRTEVESSVKEGWICRFHLSSGLWAKRVKKRELLQNMEERKKSYSRLRSMSGSKILFDGILREKLGNLPDIIAD